MKAAGIFLTTSLSKRQQVYKKKKWFLVSYAQCTYGVERMISTVWNWVKPRDVLARTTIFDKLVHNLKHCDYVMKEQQKKDYFIIQDALDIYL